MNATSDLMLAYVDFFLGGDEKRIDLPPRLNERFPMSFVFGGDGSYMAPFSLHNDNIVTSLMSQVCLLTFWVLSNELHFYMQIYLFDTCMSLLHFVLFLGKFNYLQFFLILFAVSSTYNMVSISCWA